jgi:beta-glucosidase/6-phospho-beta-glucosidase/beta-galactosidase
MIKRKKVVLIIFWVFVTVVIIVFFIPHHGFNKQSHMERTNIKVTQVQLRVLSHFLIDIYEESEFPKDIKEFIQHEVFQEYIKKQDGDTIKHIIADPWGSYFIYHRVNKHDVILISKGSDQKLNTSDDIQLDVSLKQ